MQRRRHWSSTSGSTIRTEDKRERARCGHDLCDVPVEHRSLRVLRGVGVPVADLLPLRCGGPRRGPGAPAYARRVNARSEEHTSELQSRENLVCRLLLEKKKKKTLNLDNTSKFKKTN